MHCRRKEAEFTLASSAEGGGILIKDDELQHTGELGGTRSTGSDTLAQGGKSVGRDEEQGLLEGGGEQHYH